MVRNLKYHVIDKQIVNSEKYQRIFIDFIALHNNTREEQEYWFQTTI